MPSTDLIRRVELISRRISKIGLDGLLVTNETNVSYLSGFQGTDSFIVITPRKKIFITDFRYKEEAERSLGGFEIEIVRTSSLETISSLMTRLRIRRLGFESMSLPCGVLAKLKESLTGTRFAPFKNAVEELRSIKDKEELHRIKDAIEIAKKVHTKALRMLRTPRLTEKGLSSALEILLLKEGARTAFDPIVAFNQNASRPHAIPGKTPIGKNGVLLIDWGCRFNGYNCDLTRTHLLGKISMQINAIYYIIKEAHRRALETIREGIRISEVDLAARRHIQKSGYGKYFGHAVGHGIGMEVHESPSISQHNHAPVRAGMVFTIEPAIYVPGLCGVRIEDMVLATKDGCEVLTR